MKQLTIVLPITKKSATMVDTITLPLLEKFLDPDCVFQILIIADSDEVNDINLTHNSKVVLVSTEDIDPALDKWKGWRKQQAIKLCIARHVQTEFYLTYDDDVIITQPTGWNDLFVDGKPIIQIEPTTINKSRAVWYKSSIDKLQYNDAQIPDYGMGVTPQILYTDIVNNMLDRLSRNGNVVEYLLNDSNNKLGEGWTEYTMYWAYMLHNYSANLYHDCALWDERKRVCPYLHNGKLVNEQYLQWIFDDDYPFNIISSKVNNRPRIDKLLVDFISNL